MTNEIKIGAPAEGALEKQDDMDRLVPSTYMREIFREEGFEFTDSQKATMIWNAPGENRDWKLNALRELSENTEDNILRRQIRERLQ